MAVVLVTSALREWRIRHGYRLEDVSGLSRVSISHLSLIERGLREPGPAVKVRIAQGVGASVAELFPLEPVRESA